MADKITEISNIPAPSEENKLASTNITNRIIASLGQVTLKDGQGFQGRGRAYIAKVLNSTGCGFGYYNIEIYERKATICNPTTALTTVKLEGLKIGTGYGYNLDETGASTNVIVAAANVAPKYFRFVFDGQYHTDNKPVVQLIGNPIAVKACA